MPFTLGGDWTPPKQEEKKKSLPQKRRPVKVRLEKRGNTFVTVILNLVKEDHELKDLLKGIKKLLGCGGTIKKGIVEIQGSHVDLVQEHLRKQGIKAQ